jgi:hypothetical protein
MAIVDGFTANKLLLVVLVVLGLLVVKVRTLQPLHILSTSLIYSVCLCRSHVLYKTPSRALVLSLHTLPLEAGCRHWSTNILY